MRRQSLYGALERALRAVEVARGTVVVRLHTLASFGTVSVARSSRIGPGFRLRAVHGAQIHLARISTGRNVAMIADGGRIDVEEGCFFNDSCTVSSRDSIRIGAQTRFGENVKIYDHDHTYECGQFTSDYVSAPVSVGSRCWFGSNVVILRGVTVCDDVVVGANGIIAKSISEPGVYVAGGGLRRIR